MNIISNLNNGVGLQRDYELLREALEGRGHHVHGIQFNAPRNLQNADVNIFLEVVVPGLFTLADKQWAIPNPEWWFVGWDAYVWDKILAKTRDCQRIFTEKVGDRCFYLGWEARDLYNPIIMRQALFLHVAGKSKFKNTYAVIAGCKLAGVHLTLVAEHYGPHRRETNDVIAGLLNSHQFHLMPSAYEGYGQVLHEAMGCGQIVITTDAPPMNELYPVLLIPSVSQKFHHAGQLHTVSAEGVAAAIAQALQLSADVVRSQSDWARQRFLQEKQTFHTNLNALLEEL